MLEINDVVRAIPGAEYRTTDRRVLCKVVDFVDELLMRVMVVGGSKLYGTNKYTVSIDDFVEYEVSDYLDEYPDAIIAVDRIPEYYEKRGYKEGSLMDKTVKYVLSDEERESLVNEMETLLKEYNYNVTKKGINAVIDEWIKNKGWMIELFKKHPNYNGKYQIVFEQGYNRKIDAKAIEKFADYIYEYTDIVKNNLPEYKITAFTYGEAIGNRDVISSKLYYMKALKREFNVHNVVVDGTEINEYERDKKYFEDIVDIYRKEKEKGNIFISSDNRAYNKNDYSLYKNSVEFESLVRYCREPVSDEVFADKINDLFNAKAVKGQKVSRIVNKVCKIIGANEHPEYEKQYAKYSDAINPRALMRTTVISCHPIDYYTMSFGNSWASCHTIDKENRRKAPNCYSGAYSSGTESYMLDPSSFVFYTIDSKYNGNSPELEDKINRNMFHIGEDKLVQGRVYPQANDGENGFYTEIRNIVQKVIAECMGVPNKWRISRGASACSKAIYSDGTHYRDYTTFDACNVSTIKREDNYISDERIEVGHNPICPGCGKTHGSSDNITCRDCINGHSVCTHCGTRHPLRRMIEIDGNMYCEDCVFYCRYHSRYELISEVGPSIYVGGYGEICREATEDVDMFATCERCGEVFAYVECNGVITEDGHFYCGHDCAELSGYEELSDGTWVHLEDARFCENCYQWVRASEFDETRDLCMGCAESVRENESTGESEVA